MDMPFYNDIGRYKVKRERDSFKTPLVVEVMESGKRFRLFCQFTYNWGKMVITVPAGFVTDFASIPRFARLLLPKLGKYNKAAVIHDFIYRDHIIRQTSYNIPFVFSRKHADRCFRDAMADLGVVKWKRTMMWLAVRIGGWVAWRKR